MEVIDDDNGGSILFSFGFFVDRVFDLVPDLLKTGKRSSLVVAIRLWNFPAFFVSPKSAPIDQDGAGVSSIEFATGKRCTFKIKKDELRNLIKKSKTDNTNNTNNSNREIITSPLQVLLFERLETQSQQHHQQQSAGQQRLLGRLTLNLAGQHEKHLFDDACLEPWVGTKKGQFAIRNALGDTVAMIEMDAVLKSLSSVAIAPPSDAPRSFTSSPSSIPQQSPLCSSTTTANNNIDPGLPWAVAVPGQQDQRQALPLSKRSSLSTPTASFPSTTNDGAAVSKVAAPNINNSDDNDSIVSEESHNDDDEGSGDSDNKSAVFNSDFKKLLKLLTRYNETTLRADEQRKSIEELLSVLSHRTAAEQREKDEVTTAPPTAVAPPRSKSPLLRAHRSNTSSASLYSQVKPRYMQPKYYGLSRTYSAIPQASSSSANNKHKTGTSTSYHAKSTTIGGSSSDSDSGSKVVAERPTGDIDALSHFIKMGTLLQEHTIEEQDDEDGYVPPKLIKKPSKQRTIGVTHHLAADSAVSATTTKSADTAQQPNAHESIATTTITTTTTMETAPVVTCSSIIETETIDHHVANSENERQQQQQPATTTEHDSRSRFAEKKEQEQEQQPEQDEDKYDDDEFEEHNESSNSDSDSHSSSSSSKDSLQHDTSLPQRQDIDALLEDEDDTEEEEEQKNLSQPQQQQQPLPLPQNFNSYYKNNNEEETTIIVDEANNSRNNITTASAPVDAAIQGGDDDEESIAEVHDDDTTIPEEDPTITEVEDEDEEARYDDDFEEEIAEEESS